MYSVEQINKLKQLFTESIAVYTEIDDLNTGLTDTINAIATELEIKPGLLKKAIKIAQKSRFTEHTESHDIVTDILETVGRTV